MGRALLFHMWAQACVRSEICFFSKTAQVACMTLKFEKHCSNPFPTPDLNIRQQLNIKWVGTYGFAAGTEIRCIEKN